MNSKKWIWIVLIIVVVIAIGVLAYWLGTRYSKRYQSSQAASSVSQTMSSTSSSSEISESRVFSDPEMKFSITIPEGYGILRNFNSEGGPSAGIMFGKKMQEDMYLMSGIASNNIQFTDWMSQDVSLEKVIEEFKRENPEILGQEDYTIDGQQAIKYKTGGLCDGIHIISIKDQYVFEGDYFCGNETDSKIFLDIVNSFKWPK